MSSRKVNASMKLRSRAETRLVVVLKGTTEETENKLQKLYQAILS